MSRAPTTASTPFSAANDFVSSDFSELASHMSACNRSHGRFFQLRATLESLHAVASPRIMTSAAVLAAGGLFLLAFA